MFTTASSTRLLYVVQPHQLFKGTIDASQRHPPPIDLPPQYKSNVHPPACAMCIWCSISYFILIANCISFDLKLYKYKFVFLLIASCIAFWWHETFSSFVTFYCAKNGGNNAWCMQNKPSKTTSTSIVILHHIIPQSNSQYAIAQLYYFLLIWNVVLIKRTLYWIESWFEQVKILPGMKLKWKRRLNLWESEL